MWQDASKRFEDRLRGVDEYLKYRKVSVQMRRRIQNYYGGCWRKSGAIYEEAFVLQDLPTDLRATTMLQISVEAIAQVPVLKGLQDLCAAEVYVNLYPHCFDEGLIYAAKELGSEMYFITSGQVQIQGFVLHARFQDAARKGFVLDVTDCSSFWNSQLESKFDSSDSATQG